MSEQNQRAPVGSQNVPLQQDVVDGAQITITLPHHKVHEGEYYSVTDSDTINSGAVNRKVWQFTTPNTATRFHYVIVFSASDSGILTFNEDPTINVAGALLTPYNNDRNSANVTTLIVRNNTTLTADGTPLTTKVIGTDAPASRIGGTVREESEVILKQNEDYVLIFQANNNATVISMNAEWYEA